MRVQFPDDLRRRVYIDPMNVGVTFGTYISYGYEQYLRSFRTLLADAPNPVTEWLIKTDISVQQIAKRSTWLMEMWQSDTTKLTSDALYILSEQDRYVNASGVRDWLEHKGNGVKIVVAPEWRHGSCVLDADGHGVWARIFNHVHCGTDGDGDGQCDSSTTDATKSRRVSRRQSTNMGGFTKRVVSFVDGLNEV